MSEERKQSMFLVAYKGQNTADQVYETLRGLQRQEKVKIKTAVVLTRMPDGKLKLVHKRRVTVGKGMVGGGFLGLLLFGPGAIVSGVVAGGLIGASRSEQRAALRKFLDEKLGPDESALAILISDADWAAVQAATEQYGRGEVLEMELTPEDEAELNALAGKEEVVEGSRRIVVEDDPEVEVVE